MEKKNELNAISTSYLLLGELRDLSSYRDMNLLSLLVTEILKNFLPPLFEGADLEVCLELGERIKLLESYYAPDKEQRIINAIWNELQNLKLSSQRMLEFIINFLAFMSTSECDLNEKNCSIIWMPIVFKDFLSIDQKNEKALENLIKFFIQKYVLIWFDPFAEEILKRIDLANHPSGNALEENEILMASSKKINKHASDGSIKPNKSLVKNIGKDEHNKKQFKAILNIDFKLAYRDNSAFLSFVYMHISNLKVLAEPSKVLSLEDWLEKSSRWTMIRGKGTKVVDFAVANYVRFREYFQEALVSAILVFRHEDGSISQANISKFENFNTFLIKFSRFFKP